MDGREPDIQAPLASPAEVRRSLRDPAVYLFYKTDNGNRWLCAVVKQANGHGFLITAYRTDKIKERVRVWPN
ncbi:MAG: hypothetical protein NZ602_09900 [Thermoguttaceae bacterium]|nr:hypothetical protein [Thermoguttaceae bacterium]MDW8037131.1 hypothetical protein [Thermoguttaceae bacterium]